ncbi:hypothetical protein K502DRAFT_343110 [Neoconidiobolus thromboides FSU 785]|nr:hypothetical protein K502DRAFT_343110 [Neoconidiobolus thromboides FSU 785]
MFKSLFICIALSTSLVVSQCDNISIQSTGDVSKASGCTKANSVFITGEGLGDISLDSLQSVSDTIKITGTSTLTKVSMKKLESAKNIEIDNNSGLNLVTLSSLSGLQGYIFLSGNSKTLSFSAPKLSTIAGNGTISDVGTIDISGLKSIKNALSFSDNSFKNVSLPNLSEVSQSLSFNSNDQVSSIKLDKLETIGGALLIANNTNLKSAEFPNLSSVNGALDVNGNISKLDLPVLNEVKGNADIQSGAKDLSCDNLNRLQAVVAGKFNCNAGSSTNSTKNNTKSTSSKGNNSSDAFTIQLSYTFFAASALTLFSFIN